MCAGYIIIKYHFWADFTFSIITFYSFILGTEGCVYILDIVPYSFRGEIGRKKIRFRRMVCVVRSLIQVSGRPFPAHRKRVLFHQGCWLREAWPCLPWSYRGGVGGHSLGGPSDFCKPHQSRTPIFDNEEQDLVCYYILAY